MSSYAQNNLRRAQAIRPAACAGERSVSDRKRPELLGGRCRQTNLDDIARVFRQELLPQVAEELDDSFHPGNRQVGEVFRGAGLVLL